jgi:NADH-quinone oxidoreductase subunit G
VPVHVTDVAKDKDTVDFTLDGKTVEGRPGELVIAAAERSGTYIPRFCYHPRMAAVGMCRMCLVEIDTGRGPTLQPACMIPVAEGMTVETESERTKKAQDGVLEFLLINHPLDCPVCDKGGECPLQDQTLTFGPGESRFVEEKRHYAKPIPLSDLVHMDRERCILCDRCTRFQAEVAGDPTISFIDRGDQTQVNTFPDHPFASYFSGNTVQICPVGALLARPYRFKARPWDLDQVESTCTSCSVGCRMAVQSSANEVVRYLGVDVDPVNWGWLCDKGRFDFEHLNSDARLGRPLVKGAGGLEETGWAEALGRAGEGLAAAVAAGSVAVLGGARGTNEDAFAWSKLARTVLRTDSVDCQLGDGLPAEAVLGFPRATIDAAMAADVVVLLGPDIKEELPVLYLRLRDAVKGGTKLVELSATELSTTPLATASLRHRPGDAASVVQTLLSDDGGDGDREVARARELLRGAGSVVVILGRPSLAESADATVAAAAALVEALPDVKVLSGLRRGNVHGALDMGLAPGVLPGRVTLDEAGDWLAAEWGELPERGDDARGILTAAAEGRLQALVLLGADPARDFPDAELARRGLEGAGFVLAVDCFVTDSVRHADVVLPAAGFAEKPGTTTNLEGRVSRLHQKVTAPGTARPDWEIAVMLADQLGGDLGLESLEAIWDEIERVAPSHHGMTRARIGSREGFDGIVAGEVADAEGTGAPPTMSQVDEPGITAADTHGLSGVDVSAHGGGEVAPAPPEGDASQESAPAVAEAAGASGDEAQYSEGQTSAAVEAQEKSVEAEHEQGGSGLTADGGGTEEHRTAPRRPALLRYSSPRGAATAPPLDGYSLRLVSSRRLYDEGTLNAHSPSLAPLASGSFLRVHPADLSRQSFASGDRVKVVGRGSVRSLELELRADATVPRGAAALTFNQPGGHASELIDSSLPVTDVRLDRLGGA